METFGLRELISGLAYRVGSEETIQYPSHAQKFADRDVLSCLHDADIIVILRLKDNSIPWSQLFDRESLLNENPGITMNEGNNRISIQPGLIVDIVRKEDQRTGRKTRGIVREILTNSAFHPHGIKVRLKDGTIGRVSGIIETDATTGETRNS
jgi:uncharacterized repeat protein (TIGR03833 family)